MPAALEAGGGGRINQAVIDIIRRNSREPEKIGGDVHAQLACLDVGAQAIRRMAERHGPGTVVAAMTAILDQSEASMRAVLRGLPDGTYKFTDIVDDDGQSAIDLTLWPRWPSQASSARSICHKARTRCLGGELYAEYGEVGCLLRVAFTGRGRGNGEFGGLQADRRDLAPWIHHQLPNAGTGCEPHGDRSPNCHRCPGCFGTGGPGPCARGLLRGQLRHDTHGAGPVDRRRVTGLFRGRGRRLGRAPRGRWRGWI